MHLFCPIVREGELWLHIWRWAIWGCLDLHALESYVGEGN